MSVGVAAGLLASTLPGCARVTEAPTAAGPLMTWDDLTSRPLPKADRTFTYGPDAYQLADLWLPEGRGPHPVVLMVHGGCWTTAIADRSLMNHLAGDLRKRGIAVWNIDYRGVDRPGGGYPGTFLDVGEAADALREVAGRHRLDLKRLVAVGHSAGGHLALWLAARSRLPAASALRTAHPLAIPAVISLGGLPDLEAAATPPGSGCGTEVVEKLVGPPTMSSRDVYADTSIPRMAPLGVRQWLVNGQNDRIIPNAYATDYKTKMEAKGDTVEIAFIPATGHVELVAPGTRVWAHTLRLIDKALARR